MCDDTQSRSTKMNEDLSQYGSLSTFHGSDEVAEKAKIDAIKLVLSNVAHLIHEGDLPDAVRMAIMSEITKCSSNLTQLLAERFTIDQQCPEYFMGIGAVSIEQGDRFGIYSVDASRMPGGHRAEHGAIQYVLRIGDRPRLVSENDVMEFLEQLLIKEAVQTEYGEDILTELEEGLEA